MIYTWGTLHTISPAKLPVIHLIKNSFLEPNIVKLFLLIINLIKKIKKWIIFS